MTPLNVLIVDSDKEMVKMLCHFFKARFEGCAPDHCHSLDEALGIVETKSLQVVVTEIILPHQGANDPKAGFKLIETINQKPEPTNVYVISDNGDSNQTEKQATNLGVKGYFQKPFDPEILFEEVSKAI